MIFCMKVPYYKGQKRARGFFRKKSGSLIIHENVSKNGQNEVLDHSLELELFSLAYNA